MLTFRYSSAMATFGTKNRQLLYHNRLQIPVMNGVLYKTGLLTGYMKVIFEKIRYIKFFKNVPKTFKKKYSAPQKPLGGQKTASS